MTTKTVNYTPEQTAQMVADYQAGTSVEMIAETFGKTVRSVVAKLSREKVYVAKAVVVCSVCLPGKIRAVKLGLFKGF